MSELSPEQVEAAARALVKAERTSLGIELTLPVTYPDGELVTVVADLDQSGCVVHDASSGAMFLAAAGLKKSRKLTRKLEALVGRYGCEFVADKVIRRCSADQAAFAAIAVANASRAVGDQAAEVRRQAEQDFAIAVTDRLREIVGPRFRANELVKGNSGRAYRVPGVVLDKGHRKAVAFVAPLPNRSAVGGQFAEFYDLKQAYSEVTNESVYDEQHNLRDEDRRLLGLVSEVIPFDQTRIRFSRILAA